MNYVELHIGDYDKDTAHLSACEDGIYGRLIRRYYNTEAPLPADVRAVQRLARAHSKEERQAVADLLEEFFTPSPEGWRHKRCDQEIERFRGKREKARQSAEARWKKRSPADADADVCERIANASEAQCEGNAPRARIPHASHQTPDKSNALHPSTSADRSSGAEALARALRDMGWSECGAGNPDLIAAAAAGVTVAGIRDAAIGKADKPVAYIARRAIGRLADATASAAPATQAAPRVDPEHQADVAWATAIENQIIEARHLCDVSGLIEPEERDARIRDLKATLAAGRQPQSEALA